MMKRIREIYDQDIEPELGKLLEFEHVELASLDESITERIIALFRRFRIKFFGQSYPKDGDPVTGKFRRRLENTISKNAKSISRLHKTRYEANARFVADVSILQSEPWLNGYLQDWTMQNVSLIKDIPLDSIEKMQQLITTSVLRGDSRKFLKDQVKNLLNISEGRAKLIARDQTSKLYGTLTKLRSLANGWEYYEWVTAGDERVREIPRNNRTEDHAKLEGKIFKFTEPPITVLRGKRAGERNNPTESIQCRCIAAVIFDRQIINSLKKQSDGSYEIPKAA